MANTGEEAEDQFFDILRSLGEDPPEARTAADGAHSQPQRVPGSPPINVEGSGILVGKDDPRLLLVPEQSPDELAQGLPNRGKRILPIRIPDSCTPKEFRAAVIGTYAEYTLEGTVTLEGVSKHSGITKARLQHVMATPEYRKAAEARGVLLSREATGLSEAQDLALMVLLDPFDGLTMAQKLRKAGISNPTYRAWMRNPLFAEQMRRGAEQILHSSNEAVVQLARKASDGDLGAIKFLFEVNGKYNPRERQAVDILVIMNKILESLARNVRDPAALEAVALDMREIAESAGLMNAPAVKTIEQ